MDTKRIELDIDYVGSQSPADQPTAEDFAAISRYIQAQKRQATEAAQLPLSQAVPQKEAA